MKLLSDQGVLPGTGSATGATGTYNPQSQTCLTSSGCSLDGSGCGPLGTDRDVEMCSNSPPSPPVSSPVSSPVAGPTQGDVNGEEACEEHGYTESECLSIGIDDDCCEWDENECWSKIGQQTCVMSSNPTPSSPVVAPSPVSSPVVAPSPVSSPSECVDSELRMVVNK